MRNVNLLLINVFEVLEIEVVRQGILRNGKDRLSRLLGFATGSYQPPTWVSAAKVNTPGRNGIDDALTERSGIFRFAHGKLFARQLRFNDGLPHFTRYRRVCPRAFVLSRS